MGVKAQEVTDRYAIYHSDCLEVMPSFPDGSMHLSAYSPPFARKDGGALYNYTSSDRDLSNSRTYAEFMEHYGMIVREIHRLTMPGRMTVVHCADIPTGNSGCDGLMDFPGDIIRLHQQLGWTWTARHHVWKDPLWVRNRTLTKGLAHRTIVDDASKCSSAGADYLLVFRRSGENPVPVEHPNGFTEYAGATPVPAELHRFRGWAGDQKQNRFSHKIWQRYASSCWGDVRMGRVVPFHEKDDEDERHPHPLQLDVIERAIDMWTNPGERVFTPFMGVGSEVFGAIRMGRFGVGVELKGSYYAQARQNVAAALVPEVVEDALISEADVMNDRDLFSDEDETLVDPSIEAQAVVELIEYQRSQVALHQDLLNSYLREAEDLAELGTITE